MVSQKNVQTNQKDLDDPELQYVFGRLLVGVHDRMTKVLRDSPPDVTKRVIERIKALYPEMTNKRIAEVCYIEKRSVRNWFRDDGKGFPMKPEQWALIWKELHERYGVNENPLSLYEKMGGPVEHPEYLLKMMNTGHLHEGVLPT